MQKNWYIIYTKEKNEKKVSTILSKKKVENFLPLNQVETFFLQKKKLQLQPLFKSLIFVHIEAAEIPKVKAIDGVVNLLYWKGEVAVINEGEISIIKEFIASHRNISVENTIVSKKDKADLIDVSKYYFSGNLLTIKNTMAKVNLPTLGLRLIAKIESTDSLYSDSYFGEKKMLMQS